MPVSPGYQRFILDQLEPHFVMTAKKMFGGVGLYADGYFFALIANDRLYFKVDDTNRTDFEAAGMEPFRPYGDERSMAYWEIPIEVLEDADALRHWASKALTVAQAAQQRKRKK